MPIEEVLIHLETSTHGLSGAEAALRLEKYGPNTLKEKKKMSPGTFLRAVEELLDRFADRRNGNFAVSGRALTQIVYRHRSRQRAA